MTLPNPQQPPYKKSVSSKTEKFLDSFPGKVFCYISDAISRPVITSDFLDMAKQELGYGVFFSVNGFKESARKTENLMNLNCFFLDVDYPDKLNRTEENVRAYKRDVQMEVFDPAGNTPPPTYVVETKNGVHLYWMFSKPVWLNEMPHDQVPRLLERYRAVEEALIKKFDGDPGAKDVARILRVPETYHQKDPYDQFEVALTYVNEENTYTFDELAKAFGTAVVEPDAWGQKVSDNAIDAEVKAKIEKAYPKLQRRSYSAILERTAVVPEGMRNKTLLIIANACREGGWTLDQTLNHFGANFYGLGFREIRRTIQSAYEHTYEFGYNNEVMNTIVDQEERQELSRVTSSVLSKGAKEVRDQNNEQQKKMYLTYEHTIASRYPHLKFKLRGDFYDYRNGVYVPLQVQEVQAMFLREMMSDGLMNYRKVSSVNDKIACFKSLEDRIFQHEDENPDPNIINFENGLLNLDTYTLNPHTPAYLSTIQIPIKYDPRAPAPRWRRFVDEIMSSDREQVRLLAQIAGYCLTADIKYSKAFIFYGHGSNGKSMFVRLLSQLVGNQNTSSVKLSTLNKQFGLAGIIGKRFNVIDEITGNYFESDVIKGLVSGERMSADIKFRPEPIEFIPTVKIIFSVNELPKINDTTHGLYRRFIIIPFERTFAVDPTLEPEMLKELPGILNWALLGLKDIRARGFFNETQKNADAMKAFKIDNSPLAEFIATGYDPVSDKGQFSKFKIKVGDLYKQYRDYCFELGYKAKAMSNFSRELQHSRFDGYPITVESADGLKFVYGIRPKYNLGGDRIIYE